MDNDNLYICRMKRMLITMVCGLMAFVTVSAADVNTDSIRTELDKIVLLKPQAKSDIDKYKKGVLKGDLKSIELLGKECMTGTNVKADLNIGLNLLETAANEGYIDAQYDLGNYYFIFWLQKPSNNSYFSTANKWLRKSVKSGDLKSYTLQGQLFFEYGKYNNEPNFLAQAKMLLETVPGVDQVNDKDDNVISAQAMLGSVCLGQWRMAQDTLALRDAKKYYRMVLKSQKEYPTYSKYIDSLVVVLSQGVPMSIDPKDEKAQAQPQQQMGGFGGMGGGMPMGGMGGFGGGMGGPGGQRGGQGGPGGQGGFQGVPAQFPGGQFQMMQYVRSNTFYPKDCEDARIKGTAQVQFTIDVDGSVVNPKVTNEINHLLGQEALRTIMLMPDWIPATQDDKPVQFPTQTSVSFGSQGGGMGMMF